MPCEYHKLVLGLNAPAFQLRAPSKLGQNSFCLPTSGRFSGPGNPVFGSTPVVQFMFSANCQTFLFKWTSTVLPLCGISSASYAESKSQVSFGTSWRYHFTFPVLGSSASRVDV